MAGIKAGDVVRLKSGGPKMTVDWLEDGQAHCIWFDEKGQIFDKVFQVGSLEPW